MRLRDVVVQKWWCHCSQLSVFRFHYDSGVWCCARTLLWRAGHHFNFFGLGHLLQLKKGDDELLTSKVCFMLSSSEKVTRVTNLSWESTRNKLAQPINFEVCNLRTTTVCKKKFLFRQVLSTRCVVPQQLLWGVKPLHGLQERTRSGTFVFTLTKKHWTDFLILSLM